MGDNASDHDAIAINVRPAFQRWTRTVFGAPKQAQDLITRIEPHDEVIERLVTQVARRDVREMRTATRERRSTTSPIALTAVDPFAHTTESLRVASQYIAQCESCAASGMVQCNTCRGSCNVTCHNCGGSGKQRSEKTGRPINCKICKKSGRVLCGTCTARGTISCRTCFGSGHQLAWLTFDESEHWQVSITPDNSLVVLAHRELAKARPLAQHELSAFSVVEENRSHGPIDLRRLEQPYRHLPHAERSSIDRRLERIASQQYLRLAIVRRDVTYEMCGTQGTVALSGNSLLGATTADAIRPISRRLRVWLASVVLVTTVGILLRTTFVGSSYYFESARAGSNILIAGLLACAIPAFGALLRAWRGGLRFARMPQRTIVFTCGALLALLGIVATGLIARPSTADVRTALSSGATARARSVLDALREYQTGPAIDDLDDRVVLAEAAQATGTERLRLLDAVASHHRVAAPEATTAARIERLTAVRRAVGAKDTKTALVELEQWFHDDRSAEVAEERARVHEAAVRECAHIACRLGEALQANAAHSSPARASQVEALRVDMTEALTVERVDAKAPTLARLQQLRRLGDAGTQTLAAIADDEDLRARAGAAIAFAAAERAKAPLLRAESAVVEELLGSLVKTENAPRADLRGAYAYVVFDASKCAGIYAVGSEALSRALKSEAWPADRLLSQALGKPVNIKRPQQLTATVQWYEGGYPVMVRWRSGQIVELRIGVATP